MIIGGGIDVVEIARVEKAIARRGKRLRARLYTERELADCERRGRPAPHFALRFAVKEAGMKAIGTGWRRGVAWRDFETVETERGLGLELRGRALEIARERGFARAWVGASYTRTHAFAQVVLEGGSPSAP
ncbi:MAG TPA: holo-ACP synthase [Myxococcota bacterium]|nr:holo-ACP synthase [Myxococcota bacterium]